MTVIELPNDEAAGLAVRASAHGLRDWFKKLANRQTRPQVQDRTTGRFGKPSRSR